MAYVDLSGYAYGTNSFGSDSYGSDVFPAIIQSSASIAGDGIRQRPGDASIAASASVSAIGGFTAQVQAQVSASSGATCGSLRVREGDANPQGVAANSCIAVAEFTSGAVVSSTTVTASVAEQFVLKLSNKYSYGTAPYGSYEFDQADFNIPFQPSASVTGAAFKTAGGSAQASAQSTNSGDSIRVRESDGESPATATITASAVFLVTSGGTASAEASIDTNYIRERNIGGSTEVDALVEVLAREKWEPLPKEGEIWSTIQ